MVLWKALQYLIILHLKLNVDALYRKLTNNCIETISEPVTLSHVHPKINGKRFFYFYDPDGNIIEVFNKKEGLYSE